MPQNDTLTLFPAGQADADSFKGKSLPNEQYANCMLVPPLDSDYMQYSPNNRLLQFLKLSIVVQEGEEKSLKLAQERAEYLYKSSIINADINNLSIENDNSLRIVRTIVDEHVNAISSQEFQELQLGLRELTSEQLLRMIDEEARLVKVTANDHLQKITTIFCVVTTALTMLSFVTTGPGAAGPAVAKEAGRKALKNFFSKCTLRVSSMYAATLGNVVTAGELIGDGMITFREIMNVYDEMADATVKSDRDAWRDVSKLMQKKVTSDKFTHRYFLKPAEMIGLFAAWERGDRSVLDDRLRNLIYGRAAAFSSDQYTFSQIKFRINRIGNDVERQIGTPSLFPAFSLMLRFLARSAIVRGKPILGPLLLAARWFARGRQYDSQQ